MIENLSHHYFFAAAMMFSGILIFVISLFGIIIALIQIGTDRELDLPASERQGRKVFIAAVTMLCLGVLGGTIGTKAVDIANTRANKEIRAAVLAKYDVQIEDWGDYYSRSGKELASIWKINGENVTCTVKAMKAASDPILFVCGGNELPSRS